MLIPPGLKSCWAANGAAKGWLHPFPLHWGSHRSRLWDGTGHRGWQRNPAWHLGSATLLETGGMGERVYLLTAVVEVVWLGQGEGNAAGSPGMNSDFW